MSNADFYRVCSICRTAIPYGSRYYRCSVSTCNSKRLPLFFCSLPCWEAHLPEARHRDPWAEEARAPSREEAEQEAAAAASQAAEKSEARQRRRVAAPSPPADGDDAELPRDVLVVVSKFKKYVKERSGMSTSDGVTSPLSDLLRRVATEAIKAAARDERRTVLDRDVAAAIDHLLGD